MLRQMMDRQSEVYNLLEEVRTTEDKTKEMALAGHLGWPDDKIVAVVLTRLEMTDPEREVQIIDLIWAGEFMDHLDTQNMTVRARPRKILNDPTTT